MRFVVTGEWTRNDFLRAIVWCFLAYTLLLWVTNAGLYFFRMGLTATSVIEYYRGSEVRYLQPRSLHGLMETLHFHSFAMGILLLTLTHLLLFVPISARVKTWGIAAAFTAGIGDELSGWAVRFLHPWFAYAKIGSFLVLEGTILWLMVLVARALLLEQPSMYAESREPPQPY